MDKVMRGSLDALDRMRSGDLVEELILAYRPLVYAAARQLSPRAPLDEDLLQCGLIGLWRAAERWDGVRPFGALARHCVRSEMVDYLRRKGRRVPALSLEGLRAGEPAGRDPYGDLELRASVEAAFPPGSRERALLLALCDGVSLTRCAQALGVRRQRARELARRAWYRVELGRDR